MQTTKWSPPLWKSMFYVAAGYDLNETPKYIKDEQYKNFFKSIGDILPCSYCRQSYGKFYDSLDINRYMSMPSCGLIRFVYDLKECVNQKLVGQEHKALQEEFENLKKHISPSDEEFWKQLRDKAHKICYTKPAPPFEEVVANIMKDRASCSAKMKSCRNPLTAKYPTLSTHISPGPNISGKLDRDVYTGGKKKRASSGSKARKSLTKKRKSSVKLKPKSLRRKA